jgi:hypothetical protein
MLLGKTPEVLGLSWMLLLQGGKRPSQYRMLPLVSTEWCTYFWTLLMKEHDEPGHKWILFLDEFEYSGLCLWLLTKVPEEM